MIDKSMPQPLVLDDGSMAHPSDPCTEDAVGKHLRPFQRTSSRAIRRSRTGQHTGLQVPSDSDTAIQDQLLADRTPCVSCWLNIDAVPGGRGCRCRRSAFTVTELDAGSPASCGSEQRIFSLKRTMNSGEEERFAAISYRRHSQVASSFDETVLERVRFTRSTRPLAWLELAQMISMFNSASARPNCVMPEPPCASRLIRKTECLSE